MTVFDKDYNNLTIEDIKSYELYKSFQILKNESIFDGILLNQKRSEILSKNSWIENYESLFPQNHLNITDLVIQKNNYIDQVQRFEKLINGKNINERVILNFISIEKAYFIIGSIFQRTNFGHHDRYIFREISLPPNFQADFLLIGKNSLGFHFLFIELENPTGDIILKNGNFGNSVRKGLNQIEDWKSWVEKNLDSLRNALIKTKSPNLYLPNEFFEYDSTRFSYAVIVGRRSHFTEKANLRRRKYSQQGIMILHYDNVIDECQKLLNYGNY